MGRCCCCLCECGATLSKPYDRDLWVHTARRGVWRGRMVLAGAGWPQGRGADALSVNSPVPPVCWRALCAEYCTSRPKSASPMLVIQRAMRCARVPRGCGAVEYFRPRAPAVWIACLLRPPALPCRPPRLLPGCVPRPPVSSRSFLNLPPAPSSPAPAEWLHPSAFGG